MIGESPMRFCLLILAAPGSTGARSAWHFTRTALSQGHEISRLFFYHDGVHNASALTAPPRDEQHLPAEWAELITRHHLPATVCVASGVRKGVIDSTQARRLELDHGNVRPEFKVAGLGDLVSGAADADRFITFGP